MRGSPVDPHGRERTRLSDYLLQARRRSGLSIRKLAEAMGVSPATVLGAERGSNPRASTLEAYLRELPGLSAHSLLQASADSAPAASPAAWLHYREIHGFSAAELELAATLGSAGELRQVLSVKGLRSHRESLRNNPQERTLLLTCVTLGSPAVLRDLRYLENRKLEPRLLIEDGPVLHHYRFPSALDRIGIGYRREEAAVAPVGSEQAPLPFARGLRVDVRFPVASLSLRFSFEGDRPPDLRAAAWLRHQAVRPGDEDLLPQLHPGGLPLRWKRGGRTCLLEVEQPLVGTCYGLGWDDSA